MARRTTLLVVVAMAFLLADSFQVSLEKLNGEEQKADKLATSKATKKLLIIAIGNIRNPELAGLPLQAMLSLAVTVHRCRVSFCLQPGGPTLPDGVTLPGAHQSSPLGLGRLARSHRPWGSEAQRAVTSLPIYPCLNARSTYKPAHFQLGSCKKFS
jgi:hypothetical protein